MSRDEAAVLDILNAGRAVLDFLGEQDQETFLRDQKTQAAVLHGLMILGEACKRLSTEYRNQHAHIPWKGYTGLRDRLIHAYDRVDLEAVWETLKKDIPGLVAFFEPLCPRSPDGDRPASPDPIEE